MLFNVPTDSQFVTDKHYLSRAALDWLNTLPFGEAIQDTRANRSKYPPSANKNRFYRETDTKLIYVSTGTAWIYATGIWRDTLSNRPAAGGLTTNDTGLLFSDTDDTQRFHFSGTAWIEDYTLTDAVTNTITTLLRLVHLTSGTAAVGFGAAELTQLHNASAAQVDAASTTVTWTNATATTETSDWTLKLRNAGAALAKAFRVYGAGLVEFIGKIKLYNNSAPTDGQLLIGNTGGASFDAATLTGTANKITVTNAAGSITLTIPSPATLGDLNVVGSLAQSSGNATFNGNLGFFAAGAQSQQASGANLTNNVTAGGTTDQIDNFTDLTTYSNDAAAIRHDIYQLARKLKQVNDALRVYGLLS